MVKLNIAEDFKLVRRFQRRNLPQNLRMPATRQGLAAFVSLRHARKEMHTTPLAASGQLVTPYRGGQIAALSAPGLEFHPWPAGQLLLYDASWRAILAIQGPEARKWLNGMITTNVRDLAPGQWAPGFQLDPKGHILASLELVCTAPDAFLLLTDEAQREGLEQRLRRFVFISKLTIEDRSASWAALRLRGARAAEAAAEAGWCPPAPEPPPVRADPSGGWTLASAPAGIPQLELVAPAAAIVALWERLQALAQPAGPDAQERDRIFSRQPLYGMDIADTELPQETGQMDHLSFTKGCYIGQEIVERIRARGAVHRHWSAFRFTAPVAPGAAIEADGRAAGKITSVAPLVLEAAASEVFALGYIRDAAPGTAVSAAGVSGAVLE